jgi:hypothetical protein
VPKRLYIAGEDESVEIDATLPASCSPGSKVLVALFQVEGDPAINVADPLFESAEAVVDPGGRVHGSVKIPTSLPRSLRSLWPGVSGACLETPFVSSNPAPLVFGIRDVVENPGNSSTFVVPRESLYRGNPKQVVHTTMTAYASGQKCATVDFDDDLAKDEEGNVRLHIGGPNQPSECSQAGATVTFDNSLKMPLVETRTVVPGVSQPIANLAPRQAPGTGPVPPATGDTRVLKGSREYVAFGFMLAGAMVAGAVLVAGSFNRRRNPR